MVEWAMSYSLKTKKNKKPLNPNSMVDVAYIVAETPEQAIEKLEEEFNMLDVELLSSPRETGNKLDA